MHALRIAIATACFQQPLKVAVRMAAEAGAAGVQLDVRDELRPGELSETGRRQFLHRLDELGLKVAALHFPARRPFSSPDQIDARVAATKSALDFAAQLGAGVVTARVGRVPTEASSDDYRLLQEVLSDLARHANHVGAILAITPTHDAPQALGELLATIKTGPIGINFDPAEFVMSGHSAGPALRGLHALVQHFEARDGVRDIDGGGLEVALGRGEVDWVELLPLLAEIPYRGWLTVSRTGGDDIVGDAVRAVQYLKQVLH